MQFDPTEHPHRRYNPLTGEYVLVSPHRTKRPWQGKQDKPTLDQRPEFDSTCYLCPGNTRANGEVNPSYEHTFVFTNDFAALLPDVPHSREATDALFKEIAVRGTSRVICFSPRHDLTLAELEIPDIRHVIDVWAEQTTDLGHHYKWVQIFENRGDIMGASNPHPHGQVWASDFLPNEAAKEDRHQRDYYEHYPNPMLFDYAEQEIHKGERVVVSNDDWVAVVPYWAIWPYETMLLPRDPFPRMSDLTPESRDGLADCLKRLLVKYDNLFEISFPYSMGWHGAPFGTGQHFHWQLHGHFYPPLLRSASVRKFMVGYEMLAEAQRDITPEQAAARLRELPEVHYKAKIGSS